MAFTDQHYTPTEFTLASPIVVTVADHGLNENQRIRMTRFIVKPNANSTGMEQLNDRDFVIQHVTTNTFELWNVIGQPIDGTNYTAFVNNGLGQFTRTGPELDYENEI